MMIPLRHQVSCDLSRPISSLQRVWDAVAKRLRQVRDAVRDAEDALYGPRGDRMTYVTATFEALKYVTERGAGAELQTVTSLEDLERVVESARDKIKITTRSSRQLTQNIGDLEVYLSRLRYVIQKLQEAKQILTDELLQHLETYCTNYVKLGNTDDKFFKSLRLRTVSIHDHIDAFESLTDVLLNSAELKEEFFCGHLFSEEIAVACDCHTFPVLRIVPDLIQKIELSCDTASDWLRSDKVYVEAVENDVEITRARVNEIESKVKTLQEEYDTAFRTLKEHQAESDYFGGNADAIWKEISKMESRKARIDGQITNVEKKLLECQDNLRGLSSGDSESSEKGLRGVSGGFRGQVHSSRMSRLNKDSETYTAKSLALQEKRQKLEKALAKKRGVLEEAKDREMEMSKLTKKLRHIGKKKSALSEEIDIERTHLNEVQSVLRKRQNPQSLQNPENPQILQNPENPQILQNTSNPQDMEVVSKSRYRGMEVSKSCPVFSSNPPLPSQTPNPQNPRGTDGVRRSWPAFSRNPPIPPQTPSTQGGRKTLLPKREKLAALKIRPQRSVTPEKISRKKRKHKRSAELQKAFRIVKNHIGLGWKDLARSLPYAPSKGMVELNNDIKAIEYEHQGQLKEQAYQCLYLWYIHNGRRASVERLNNTLRELNENRLADSIEQDVIDPATDATTSESENSVSRPASHDDSVFFPDPPRRGSFY